MSLYNKCQLGRPLCSGRLSHTPASPAAWLSLLVTHFHQETWLSRACVREVLNTTWPCVSSHNSNNVILLYPPKNPCLFSFPRPVKVRWDVFVFVVFMSFKKVKECEDSASSALPSIFHFHVFVFSAVLVQEKRKHSTYFSICLLNFFVWSIFWKQTNIFFYKCPIHKRDLT